MDLASQRICVTGGAGFLGRCVCQQLRQLGVVDDQLIVPRRTQYDLTCEEDVKRLYEETGPTMIIHLAAEVGGIGANRVHPGRFFFANMAMGMHLIEHGRRVGLKKFVHTGTVCAYPKFTSVPFKEEDLWNGYPEETNAPYGVAKKALFVMLDGYKREYDFDCAVVVPVNLYGPHDNFDPETSHVIPALIRKIDEAQRRGEGQIVCWGTGTVSREFLFVNDAAEAIVRAAEKIDSPEPINLGTGHEVTIKDLAQLIADLSGFTGEIQWDHTQPDGQPRRCLDTTRAQQTLQWRPKTALEDGLRTTIEWWRHQHQASTPTTSGT